MMPGVARRASVKGRSSAGKKKRGDSLAETITETLATGGMSLVIRRRAATNGQRLKKTR
jgi:hypothetical protein